LPRLFKVNVFITIYGDYPETLNSLFCDLKMYSGIISVSGVIHLVSFFISFIWIALKFSCNKIPMQLSFHLYIHNKVLFYSLGNDNNPILVFTFCWLFFTILDILILTYLNLIGMLTNIRIERIIQIKLTIDILFINEINQICITFSHRLCKPKSPFFLIAFTCNFYFIR